MPELLAERIVTPIGALLLVVEGAALVYADFDDNTERRQRLLGRRYGAFRLRHTRLPATTEPISRYFAGDIVALDALPVAPGGTEFQARVWRALRTIPAGATLSYGALAAQLGMPRAARAVGMANGQNPISLVLPCHRLIGANGALTGYAGGIARKRWLLHHEGAAFREPPPATLPS